MAIEVYKSLIKTSPDFIQDFYSIKPIPYDLRAGEKPYLPTVNTVNLLWNNLPTSTKISQSLADFKNYLRHFLRAEKFTVHV